MKKVFNIISTLQLNTFTQPLRMSRMWHKVTFKVEFNNFEFRVFLLLG